LYCVSLRTGDHSLGSWIFESFDLKTASLFLHDLPSDVDMDAEIIVNDAVSQVDNLRPAELTPVAQRINQQGERR
jgi:hypothetical protein